MHFLNKEKTPITRSPDSRDYVIRSTKVIIECCRDAQIGAKSREYFGLKKWPLSEGRGNIPIHLVKISSIYKVFLLLKLP